MIHLHRNDEKKTGIGTIILSNIDMKNGTAEVHVKLAVANNRGKGYGTDAVNTIVKYAFELYICINFRI